jgi:predicted dehydrogenase
MAHQLGIAVVGCGYWGVNYIRLFSELPETHVVVACDQNPERLKEINRRFPNLQLETDLETVLSMDEVEAVVVCTNATHHYDVARRCLETGKHILVEKPLATTARDAEELTALALTKNLRLMVGHIFLFNAGVRKVKSYVDRGDLGQIYYFYAKRTNLGPIRNDVNALWDLAPHDVSIFNYFLGGPPEWVSAVGKSVLRGTTCEDVGFMVLNYPGDILGHIHVSWADPNKEREIVLVGSNKRIVFNDLNPQEQVRIFEKGVTSTAPEEPSNFGEYKYFMQDGDIISPKVEISEPLKNQCRHFVECVLNEQRPITDGVNGLEVVMVMEAAMRSLELHGAPVALDYERKDGHKNPVVTHTIR